MFIVVNHIIHEPEKFWGSAQENLPKLPENGVHRVIQVLPNAEMNRATCVWEAESIETLDNYLRNKVGNWSSDSYFELKTDAAMGFNG